MEMANAEDSETDDQMCLVCLHTQERGIVSNKLIVKKDEEDKEGVQYLSFRALQSVFALHCCFYLLLSGLSSQSTP